MFPIAVDYKRYSGIQHQESGDSINRQTNLAQEWSRRTGISIDQAIVLEDHGVSGLHGISRSDPDRYALARFLQLCDAGRIQPGDYLLIENLDRLSREEEVPATHLLTSILMRGIKVVQLAPYEMELTAQSDAFTIMRAVMELSRGHGESKAKQFRNRKAWEAKRAAAIQGVAGPPRKKDGRVTVAMTGRLPGWIEERDGNLCLIPDRARIVRKIYQLAASGMGERRITKQLLADQEPPFGDREPLLDENGKQKRDRRGRLRWKHAPGQRYGRGQWGPSYVRQILADRRAMGEFRPTREGARLDEIIYIPAAVTEEEWLAAQAGKSERRQHRGRPAQAVENVWQGMITDALTGTPYYHAGRLESPGRGKGKGHLRQLVNSVRGSGIPGHSFPADTFDVAVLSLLREVNPKDVLSRPGPDQVTILSQQLQEIACQHTKIKEELRAGARTSKAVLDVLAQLEDEMLQLEEKRRIAAYEAANPLSEAWGQTLASLAEHGTRDQRIRLRTLLRRVIEDIRMLVVVRGADRLAAVQILFRDSPVPRHYLIFHRPGRGLGYKGGSIGSQYACDSLREAHGLDLRKKEHAQELQEMLLTWDLNERAGELQPVPVIAATA